MEIEIRLERVREILEDKKIDVIITKNPSNIFYLTGIIEIEGYLVVDRDNLYLFVSPLYFNECHDYIKRGSFENFHLQEIKNKNFRKFISGYKKIGLINTEITYSGYKDLQKGLKAKIYLFDDFILDLRSVKDEKEIEFIKKAELIAKNVIETVKKNLKEGINELDIVAEIKYQIIKNGGRKESFEPIVASGIYSSYPHHKSRDKKIKNGEVVIIDLGADFNGYKSDLTYTFFVGDVDEEIKRIYKIVEETQKISVEYLRKENIKGYDLYKKAIENFKKYNIEKFFVHGLGHGIGIDVHEKPYLNKKGKEKLKKGNVFTIEPGIYIPEKFGIRLEKMIFLKNLTI
ncbi:MAG: Xaa-Pro peptidase family protein [Candidatus Omnitrophica bacterium]|nr:Xaa-Pro peptidase family protein [Candidatus Omnitrophota bacterium]